MDKKQRLNEGQEKLNVKPPSQNPKPTIKPAPQKPQKSEPNKK